MDGDGHLASWGEVGAAVAIADVNGDGYPDLIITAPGTWGAYDGWNCGSSWWDCGSVYVVFGRTDGTYPDPLPLASPDGSAGYRIDNDDEGPGVGMGNAVAVGDINGDKVSDIIIASQGASPNGVFNGGSYWILFGQKKGGTWPTPMPATVKLSTLNGSNGFRLDGTQQYYGCSGCPQNQWGDASNTVAAGDINGDGYDDVVIGMPGGYYTQAGLPMSAYVVFGHGGTWPTPMPLSALDGTNGFRLDGENPGDRFGYHVAIGDVNGDGYKDVLVNANSNTGNWYGGNTATSDSVYLIYGRPWVYGTPGTWPAHAVVSSMMDGIRGTQFLNGYDWAGNLGDGIAIADFDGDGINDIAFTVSNCWNCGASGTVILYGKHGHWPATYTITQATRPSYYAPRGTGQEGTYAGDVNGDGIPDLILPYSQAGNNGRNDSGSIYTVFGKSGRQPANNTWIEGGLVDGADYIRLDGATANDQIGYLGTFAVGDINNDGVNDIVFGTRYYSGGMGAAYVFYGQYQKNIISPFDLDKF